MMAIQFLCKVTIHNDCMPQFEFFQTQRTAYWPLGKDLSQIRISNQEKDNPEKFFIFAISENFPFLENYDFSGNFDNNNQIK